MRIHVQSDGYEFTIPLSDFLIFNPLGPWMVAAVIKKYAPQAPCISPKTMRRILAETKRIKKTYGSWELVRLESADGDKVTIII